MLFSNSHLNLRNAPIIFSKLPVILGFINNNIMYNSHVANMQEPSSK